MIKINNIYKKYYDKVIFENFSLSFPENKITCILGPSGIGKTTLLKLMSGLEKVDSGLITGLDNKNISYIFQEPRLFQWFNVYENLDVILKNQYPENTQRNEIITNYLNLVDLYKSKDLYPSELSGGMKQRLSIARAFAFPSDILLMDEPFNGLDMNLKFAVMESFKTLWLKTNKTVIFITHDVDEAVMLSDIIYLIDENPVKVSYTQKNYIAFKERITSNKSFQVIKEELISKISDFNK